MRNARNADSSTCLNILLFNRQPGILQCLNQLQTLLENAEEVHQRATRRRVILQCQPSATLVQNLSLHVYNTYVSGPRMACLK